MWNTASTQNGVLLKRSDNVYTKPTSPPQAQHECRSLQQRGLDSSALPSTSFKLILNTFCTQWNFPCCLLNWLSRATGKLFLNNLHYLRVSGIGRATSSSLSISHRSCGDDFYLTILDRLSNNLSMSSTNGSLPFTHRNNRSPNLVTCR